MAENFQDNISYGGSTLAVSGDAIAVGSTNIGAKSIIFNNSGSQGNLVWQPTANRTISIPDVNGTLITAINISGGTTSNNLSNIVYSNSNGVSFGLNGSTLTASVIAGAVNFSAGTTSGNVGSIVFSNSNGVSFGLNGSTITASAAGGGGNTASFFALGNTTQNSSTSLDIRSLSFNGIGAMTVGYSNGSIQLSSPVITSLTATGILSASLNGSTLSLGVPNQSINFYAASNTTQNSSTVLDIRSVSIQGAGIASVGYSNGSVVISVPSAGGSINVSAGTTSGNVNALTFSNSNGVSFGLNAGVITASAAGGGGGSINLSAGTTSNNLTNFVLSNSNGVSFGLSGSTITGSFNGTLGSVVFSNSNNIAFGSAGATTITASAFINISAGTTSGNVSNWVYSNSNNVSFGLNGSTITASIPSFQAGFTRNMFFPYQEALAVLNTTAAGSLHIHPLPDAENFQFDRMVFDINGSYNAASTANATLTMWAGLYTRNVSTLSLYASSSTALPMTLSATNSGFWTGAKLMTMGWTTTISKNDYWLGIVSNYSGNASSSAATFLQYVVSDIATNCAGILGSTTSATNQDILGLGFYSANTSGIPSSIAFSQINGTNTAALRPPLYRFLSQTA